MALVLERLVVRSRVSRRVVNRRFGAVSVQGAVDLLTARIAGERDHRRGRPPPLLATRRGCALRPFRRRLRIEIWLRARAAVGLELALARPAGADAAAEALEVLPHPAHPRQVVLELRELHLELALGAPRCWRRCRGSVGPVDDPRLESVLERPLLRRRQLLVHDQHLAAASA